MNAEANGIRVTVFVGGPVGGCLTTGSGEGLDLHCRRGIEEYTHAHKRTDTQGLEINRNTVFWGARGGGGKRGGCLDEGEERRCRRRRMLSETSKELLWISVPGRRRKKDRSRETIHYCIYVKNKMPRLYLEIKKEMLTAPD